MPAVQRPAVDGSSSPARKGSRPLQERPVTYVGQFMPDVSQLRSFQGLGLVARLFRQVFPETRFACFRILGSRNATVLGISNRDTCDRHVVAGLLRLITRQVTVTTDVVGIPRFGAILFGKGWFNDQYLQSGSHDQRPHPIPLHKHTETLRSGNSERIFGDRSKKISPTSNLIL